MKLDTTQRFLQNFGNFLAPKPMTLQQGSVYRLSSSAWGIRVLSGCAWVTWGHDAVALTEGDEKCFDQCMTNLVISAERNLPLIFEILENPNQ